MSCGGLPDGLSIDPATGVISGTPTIGSNDPFNIAVNVSDGQGGIVEQMFELTVLEDDLFNPIVERTDLLPLGPDGTGTSRSGPGEFSGRGDDVNLLNLHDLFAARENGQSLQDILDEFGYGLHGGMAIATRISGLADEATIRVEGVAGLNSIYVQLDETISDHTNLRVTGWLVDMAGGALPEWVDFDSQSGFLVLNRPLSAETVTLRIRAILDNGRRVGGNFEIDLHTGQRQCIT
jgi:hypothetical protein